MRRLLGGSLTLGVGIVLIGTLGTAASASTAASTAASTSTSTAASTAAADCATNWGSLPKGALADYTQGPLNTVRTGRHDCYDRLVLDIAGAGFGYRVEYVNQVVQDGSGTPVPLRGGAKIQIIVQAMPRTGFPASAPELADVSGYSTFRQVAGAGAFEGQTTIGLGVRARLPFQVLTLPLTGGGTRFVVDVAHTW